MNEKTEAKTIEEVIDKLNAIIKECKNEENPLGYFAALYRKVTVTVKDKIGQNYFENDKRMEHLDVVFANRYINAYDDYKAEKQITKSWEAAFVLGKDKCLIVLQHLLLGMNAHINLDLGIAAAEITTKETIGNLEGDFNKINELLSSLVGDVENDLSIIWPRLKTILKYTEKIDDFLVNFSMNIARDSAWRFANRLAGKSTSEKDTLIVEQDDEVVKLTKLIAHKGIILNIIFGIIRIGERGTVAEKIGDLEG